MSQPSHHDCICLSLAFLPRSFPYCLSFYLFPNALSLLLLTPWRVNKQILTQWVSNTSAALKNTTAGLDKNRKSLFILLWPFIRSWSMVILALFCMSYTPIPRTLFLPGTFPSLQQRSEDPDVPPLLRVTSQVQCDKTVFTLFLSHKLLSMATQSGTGICFSEFTGR